MLAFKDHLTLMARYNAHMNDKLIKVLTPVPLAELQAPRGAFFGSVFATLNHLIVADLLWLGRMRPQPYGTVLAPLDSLPNPASLDEQPCADMAAYSQMRRDLDALLGTFIAHLTDEDIASPLTYRNLRDETFTKTLGLLLSHVFNHQTHHRGQVTTLLAQMGLDIGVTDLAPMVAEA